MDRPLCMLLLQEVLDLMDRSGANTVEKLGVLNAAIHLVSVMSYRPVAELLRAADSDPDGNSE